MSDNPSKAKVAAVVAFYMIAALIMVFVNKAVLNSAPNLPLLMLVIQFIVAVLCLHLSALLTPKIEIPRRMLDKEKLKQLLPIFTTNVVGLTFNTLCLRGVDASFFQIARGLVLPLTILVSSLDSRSLPSRPILIAAGVVTFGFFFGVTPSPNSKESSEYFVALVWGGLSSLMTALHAVLIKRSLPLVDNSAIQLAYWTNLTAALALLPFVIFNGELASVMGSFGYGGRDVPVSVAGEIPVPWDSRTFVVGSLVTGVVGFLLCVAGLLSIKITSPVTHMFSSACRSVLQTVIGVWYFKDLLTVNRAVSILVILAGSMYYTYLKSNSNSQESSDRKPAERRQGDVEEQSFMLTSERDGGEDGDSVTVFEVADEDLEGPLEKKV